MRRSIREVLVGMDVPDLGDATLALNFHADLAGRLVRPDVGLSGRAFDRWSGKSNPALFVAKCFEGLLDTSPCHADRTRELVEEEFALPFAVDGVRALQARLLEPGVKTGDGVGTLDQTACRNPEGRSVDVPLEASVRDLRRWRSFVGQRELLVKQVLLLL